MRQQYGLYLLVIVGAALLLGASASAQRAESQEQASLIRPGLPQVPQQGTGTPTSTLTPPPTRTPRPTPIIPTNTPTRTPIGSPTPPPPCGLAWRTVPSPNAGSLDNHLYGVAVVAANDIWAVGHYSNGYGAFNYTLTEHWNGSSWSIVPSPNPGIEDNELYEVAAGAANDVWAVGYYDNGNGAQTLVEHWNGSAWSVVANPNPGADNILAGVAVVAMNNVWAVGDYNGGSGHQPLIEHWNGSAWNVVTSPSPSGTLNSVAAIAANDIWAVGSSYQTMPQSLILHWDGAAWSIVASPNPGTRENNLYGVAAVAANDVWAVGQYIYDTGPQQTFVEHWNGGIWSLVTSPSPGTNDALLSVAAVAANDVWAVGYYWVGGTYAFRTLVEHWNGSAWSFIFTPYPDGFDGVVVAAANDIWAVGSQSYAIGGQATTLVAHYNDPCGGATVTPTVTGTPPTATSTPVCTLFFTDVDGGNPFYSYVRCLACRNIVSGYSTTPPCTTGIPCFLPGAIVTRGQISKFVSNAAGYADVVPSTRQTFTDVPYSSPFWLYVERAYAHGVISGYSSSPPCTTGVPCFLPSNPVTRGQTAKFVSSAGGFGDPIPSTRQTFTDVPYSNAFWLYVERAYLHGVIAGYTSSPPCTTGVPCFLPGNAVTRGQTAKFIAQTFYPNCQTPQR